MVDILTVTIEVMLVVLLGVTVYAGRQYYKRLNQAQIEYENAKGTVEDIVLSFNRELKREGEKISSIAYQLQDASTTADTSYKIAENLDRKVESLAGKILDIDTQVTVVSTEVAKIAESNIKTSEKIETLDSSCRLLAMEDSNQKIISVSTKLQEVEATQEALRRKIKELEEQLQKLSITPETMSEATFSTPVMPIKRDKAMASLTETEVAVLEFLAAEGAKTAPEIKEKVQLSREHTARLMKKLYETGYLERETGKLPFKYSVKKEMEKLLRKPEQTTS
jgi:DNA-binding MarR family transcriptional regulator